MAKARVDEVGKVYKVTPEKKDYSGWIIFGVVVFFIVILA